MAGENGGWLTIEELSLRAGVTTRNIRAYQGRGLLPPPIQRPGERAAFYSTEHLARLRLIERLQARGFSLAGIKDLLEAWASGQSLEQVLGIEGALHDIEPEPPRETNEAEILGDFPEGEDRETLLRKLRAAGILVGSEHGYSIPLPSVFDLGTAAYRAGIPIDELLDELVHLRNDLHAIAIRFVRLFMRHIVTPYIEAGMPADGLGDMVATIQELRARALDATAPLFRQALADEIEAAARDSLPSPEDAGSTPFEISRLLGAFEPNDSER